MSTDFVSIVESYCPNIFKPLQGIFGFKSNCHYQTIFGSEVIRVKLLGGFPRKVATVRERFTTLDGDFIDVDLTTNFEHSCGIAVILHGLESSSDGPLVTKMASAFIDKGFACALINYRGCSGVDNLTKTTYHLGFTDDANMLVGELARRYPKLPIYLTGFSLGGNVALKLLGELGSTAMDRHVYGAVVTCVPFDPIASQKKLEAGFNRAVYAETFLDTLKTKGEIFHKRFPDILDITAIRNCRTIGDFDDHFVARVYGFKDKVDYYRQCGSKWWLSKIRVPVVAINARDDPFVEEESLPTVEDIAGAPVRCVFQAHGGHCGFIADPITCFFPPSCSSLGAGGDSDGDVGAVRKEEEGVKEGVAVPEHGWLAEELSRALLHIHHGMLAHMLT